MAIEGEAREVFGAPNEAIHSGVTMDVGAILDAIDVPIVIVDPNRRISGFNRAAATVFRIEASDIGRSPGEVLRGIPDLEQLCAAAIVEGVRSRREIWDSERLFLLRIIPSRGANGAVLTFTNVTAFRASLDQAIHEREYTKALLNTVIQPLVVLDVDLRVQTANQAFYSLWRCSRAETVDVPLFNLGDSGWRALGLWQSLRRFLSENAEFQPVEVERDFPMIGPRTVVIDARRISGANGATLLLSVHDVTERKRAHQAVLQRTAQFETLLNQAPLGVYLVDADFRIREVNPVALPVFGNIPGGVIGRDFAEIIHILWDKEYADEIVRIFRRTLETGEAHVEADWSGLRADRGKAENYEWRVDRIALPDDQYGVVCYFRDISERKRAVLNANLLAAIVESSDDAIVSKDLNGVILTWNRGAEKLFGYTAAEAVGQSITLIIPADRTDEEPAILERIRRGDHVEHFETIRIRKDGSPLNVSLTISPIKDAGGRIVGASKVARDVTQRTRQNEALTRANGDLQQFAYSASHDLQEPLRTIAVYSQMLESAFDHKLEPKGYEFIRHIIAGANRMETLLTDLRIYTQVSTTESGPTCDIEVSDVLNRVLANLEAAIEDSGASILSSDLPRIRMHEFELEQIFQNLIGNAIRYRRDVPLTISVKAERQDGDWLFSVQDNGIGIEPEYREEVFGAFKRLHSFAKYPGTGMGLAICQRIIGRAGGRIWVESEVGKGSTFFFTVPSGENFNEETARG